MTRKMYDAVSAGNLPKDGDIYLYYIDGRYANKTAVMARVPGKIYVGCTIGLTAARKGLVLDCESGDATNADALRWCQAYPGSNADLTIYTGTDNWPSLKATLSVLSTLPNILLAHYDNVATILTDPKFNIVGKQFRGDVSPGYDQSVVANYWPGVDAAPVSTTKPTPPVIKPPVVTKQPGYSGAPKLPDWSKIQAQLAKMHDWEKQQFILSLIPQGIYEGYASSGGYDNNNVFGIYYGENFVSWCVILDWYVMAIAGLNGIVPKTDNVSSFTSWAQARGQWSTYPSVGAWVNFDAGGHTETVIGFNAQYVFTKGGNTIPTGAADNGQGDGVWQHDNPGSLRTATRVVGYFAPKYADGVCPPTADPKDYRGGKAVTSYQYKAPAVSVPATPVTPATPDVPQPHNDPISEDEMFWIVQYPKATPGWKGDFVFNGVTLKHIPTEAAEAALVALGAKTKQLNAANFNALFAAFGS